MSLLKLKEIIDIQKYNKPIIIIVIIFAITTIIIFVYNKTEKEERFTNNQNTVINQENYIENENDKTLINKIQQYKNDIKTTFMKEYDFMYIINPNNETQNIQKYIHIMCSKYKLNGLFIDNNNNDNNDDDYNNDDELPQECNIIDDIPINHLEKCRFLFVPHILEESETAILKDALSLNLPCLIINNNNNNNDNNNDNNNNNNNDNDNNNNPEYLEKLNCINEKTGKTFNNETDFELVLNEFLSNFKNFTPRETFMNYNSDIDNKE
jgi:hypothetical protein